MVSVLGWGWKLMRSEAGAASARLAADVTTSVAPSRMRCMSASLSKVSRVSVITKSCSRVVGEARKVLAHAIPLGTRQPAADGGSRAAARAAPRSVVGPMAHLSGQRRPKVLERSGAQRLAADWQRDARLADARQQ